MSAAATASLIVIAKAPVAGRSKTRLCPPCTPIQAAEIAEASLLDTLSTVAAAPARRRVLALDGDPGDWPLARFDIIAQRGTGLAERLANAIADTGGPALVVGMDTPQLSVALLETATARLTAQGIDAVLGPAPDGGYWTIGLRSPDRRVFEGVPMSSQETAAAQLDRLHKLGLRTRLLPELCDVDTFGDAMAVAREAPDSNFAHTVEALVA